VAVQGKDAGAPADTARLRELRIKARNGKLTVQEQAELDNGLKARRDLASRPLNLTAWFKAAPPNRSPQAFGRRSVLRRSHFSRMNLASSSAILA
jgi:hypothetical protein